MPMLDSPFPCPVRSSHVASAALHLLVAGEMVMELEYVLALFFLFGLTLSGPYYLPQVFIVCTHSIPTVPGETRREADM